MFSGVYILKSFCILHSVIDRCQRSIGKLKKNFFSAARPVNHRNRWSKILYFFFFFAQTPFPRSINWINRPGKRKIHQKLDTSRQRSKQVSSPQTLNCSCLSGVQLAPPIAPHPPLNSVGLSCLLSVPLWETKAPRDISTANIGTWSFLFNHRKNPAKHNRNTNANTVQIQINTLPLQHIHYCWIERIRLLCYFWHKADLTTWTIQTGSSFSLQTS